jgi:hypothetical protein
MEIDKGPEECKKSLMRHSQGNILGVLRISLGCVRLRAQTPTEQLNFDARLLPFGLRSG